MEKDKEYLEYIGYRVQTFTPYHCRVSMFKSNTIVDVWHTKKKLKVGGQPVQKYRDLVEEIERIFTLKK